MALIVSTSPVHGIALEMDNAILANAHVKRIMAEQTAPYQ
jgi:hypothetical protein